jgi:Tol biopolymer transport system component
LRLTPFDRLVWQFRTGHPRVLYLAENDQRTYQIVLVDPFDPAAAPVQLTQEPLGLWDYAPAPDGSTIAYAAIREDGGSDLYAIDPDGNNRHLLLACPDAACSGPAWHPDGQRLIYERRAAGELAVGQGLPRLWWLDLASGETTRVFDDNQWLGFAAAISPDGRFILSQRIPLRGLGLPEIWLHDLTTGVERLLGTGGAWPRWLP